MGFEIYAQCFGETKRIGIAVSSVRALFPILEETSKTDFWTVQYDAKNSCEIGITKLKSDETRLESLYVVRPCAHPRLWDALSSLLRMGNVVILWPGSPPVVSEVSMGASLPNDVIESLGPARSVRSGEELLRLVNET